MQHKQEIPILIAEIKDELSKLDMLVDKISSQKGRTDNVEVVESAALRLHNFYTGCERIFSLIASISYNRFLSPLGSRIEYLY